MFDTAQVTQKVIKLVTKQTKKKKLSLVHLKIFQIRYVLFGYIFFFSPKLAEGSYINSRGLFLCISEQKSMTDIF